MAYQLQEFTNGRTEFCHVTTMLDYNVYSTHELDGRIYVPLKYYLGDLIDQHVVGEHPLHF